MKTMKTVSTVKGFGQRVASWSALATEQHLVNFENIAVRGPVTDITDHLQNIPEMRERFHLGDGLIFDDNRNLLRDEEEEEIAGQLERQQLSRSPPGRQSSDAARGSFTSTSGGRSVLTSAAPSEGSPSRKPQMDQMAVYVDNRDGSRRRTLAFFVEYKPPHKLSPAHWERGLQGLEDKDFLDEVVHNTTRPTEPDAHFEHEAKERVAKALTQAYDYMLRAGLKYSYLTTGEVFVFLHVRKDDAETLYYHRMQPAEDVGQHRDDDAYRTVRPFYTAAGQALIFSLLAPRPARQTARLGRRR